MDKILEVKNLKISFRTSSGTLKAVRNISFDLERGRTLAIVGESGSGKSVTSKAILGILAGNSIVEGGEIIYNGKDLLKISEEDMCKIRGDEISMIFQDPLSSLNPIVKIGKQITEAMLLKNKTSRREARREFNRVLELLRSSIAAATGDAAKAKELAETFDKFCIQANRLEQSYNESANRAEDMVAALKDFLFLVEKKQKVDVKGMLREFRSKLKNIKDPFFTAKYSERLAELSKKLASAAKEYKKGEETLPTSVTAVLQELEALLSEMVAQTRPDFFRIGFYALRNPGEDLSLRNIAELNEQTLKYLNENFMDDFLALAAEGVAHSFRLCLDRKKALLPELAKAKTFFSGEFTKAGAVKYAKFLSELVGDSIDRLEMNKDSIAYTFSSTLLNAIEKYFYYSKRNPQEEARFARQSKRREALIARGKTVDWKVVPKNVLDLDELKGDILKTISQLESSYLRYVENAESVDFRARSIAIVDFLKEKASKVVYVVTRAMAKERAIKLMEEVGIAEPRMRYYQYPFEFSGGMRQRIVIAIALAADPEILICDEPTTALDVTIQAQILELINRLKEKRNLSVIFITHDLGVVANMADDIAVMYAGKIVEYGTAEDVFYDSRHPYTWALLSSMPDLDTKEKLDAIPGTPPNMIYPPVGDAFADRNKYAMQIDFEQQPPMFEISETHRAATWLLHPDAPKVEIPKIITDRIERMKKKAGGATNEQ
ncbi:MAG: ATP-binding cassette domain-containing protein [Ruminococcaceae bacterium]|nr:ATP-binding cassette domain-containing protein [Oscillospiraceae bacterium]